MFVAIICVHCGGSAQRSVAAVKRSTKNGVPMYCSRRCYGAARTQFPDRNGIFPAVFLDRFWARVERRGIDDCWAWRGSIQGNGYGQATLPGRIGIGAHRLSVLISGRNIPNGLIVDHICRNRACVNPAHLRVVDQRTNALENSNGPSAINAAKDHCLRGHPFSGNNLAVLPNGNRRCRRCAADHTAAHTRRKALAGAQSKEI